MTAPSLDALARLDLATIEEVLSIDIADSRHQTAETVERARWTLAILAALRAAEAQRDALAAAAREVGGLIAEHGCSCDCDCAHTTGEHTSACDPCLACRASDVVSPLLRGAAPDVVRAGVVRAYLDADARSAIGTHRDAVALADARAALLAALAAAEGR